MITRLTNDQAKLKILRRYAIAANGLMELLGKSELPAAVFEKGAGQSFKGAAGRQFRANRATVMESLQAAKKEDFSLPSDDDCANLPVCLEHVRHECKTEVEVESEVVETAEHKGFTIEVHELTEEKSSCRFQPVILKDGKVVRRIFVRSQTAYVSLEHFAKRAINHFAVTGDWPEKQGVTIGE